MSQFVPTDGKHEQYAETKLGEKNVDYNPENNSEYLVYEPVTIRR